MNARNAAYLLPRNPRRCYEQVDDKLATKRLCERHGIPSPKTYGVISRQGEIRRVDHILGARREFVVKPARGSGGRGILVVLDRQADDFAIAEGGCLSLADLQHHLRAILAGLFSLGGHTDRTIIEQRITPHPRFASIAVSGTPDFRIIVYRGVPAMAMVRLPTHASRGRANLHQGAIGAGIHLTKGETLGGVCHDRVVQVHPDTHHAIAGLQIPRWTEFLEAAMRISDYSGLGYVGVDFVCDAAGGPMLLEANCRPGLAIQVANQCGLVPRLQLIDAEHIANATVEQRIELAGRVASIG
jgi:alpha-L-glutamate ligase-like protein